MSNPTAEQLMETYVALRDKMAEVDRVHKAKKADFKSAMSDIEDLLTDQLNKLGVDSFSTSNYTAFFKEKTWCKVVDFEKVCEFARENDMMHLFTKAVSKETVKQYMELNGDVPPPGVDVGGERITSVRRK